MIMIFTLSLVWHATAIQDRDEDHIAKQFVDNGQYDTSIKPS